MNVHVREGTLRRPLVLGDVLGSGGEGLVYAIPDTPGSVAKIYRTDAPTFAAQIEQRRCKISSMLESPPRLLSTTVDGNTLPLLAWPTDVIEGPDRSFAGFLMPHISREHSVSLTAYLREIGAPKLLSEKERCLTSRLELCRSLAGVMSDLHRQGHYVVDFKPENVRIFRESCIPCFLDNDSFSIADHDRGRFAAHMFTEEYACPELLAADKVGDDRQDRFALAVLIFQILNRSIHPFQGVLRTPDSDEENTLGRKIRQGLYPYGIETDPRVEPLPGSDHDCLLASTRGLFDQAFRANTPARPSASEWRGHFERLLRVDKPFERCARRPDSAMHIHFAGLPCTECRREQVRAREPEKAAPSTSVWRRIRRALPYVLTVGMLILLLFLFVAAMESGS